MFINIYQYLKELVIENKVTVEYFSKNRYINSNHDCRDKSMVSTKKRRARLLVFFLRLIITSYNTV